MTKVRKNMEQKFFNMMLMFGILLLGLITFAETAPAGEGELQDPIYCDSKCGCDGIYIYDPVNDKCLINFKKVMKRVTVIYDKNVDVLAEEGMAKSIYMEGEKIFKGILISVILFMTCASVCIITACLYCCRINYTDRTLSNDVKALAKKLKRDYNAKTMAAKRTPLPAISESCSVVVEPAGVMVA